MEKDAAVKYTDAQLEALEKRLAREYEQAADEVTAKLNTYLAKFAKKDAQKQADLAAGKITQEEYKTWRYGQMMTGKRWVAMKGTLTADLVNADKTAAQMINDTLPSVYAENGNYATYIAETGANIDTSWTLYSKDTVRALAEAEEISLPAAAVNIPADKKWIAKNVNSAVLQGVLQGESIAKIAERMYNVTDMSRRASVRNARTLVTSSENQGRTDCFKRAERMGIKMEQGWLATLDGRTRHSHRLVDGEWIKVGEKFSNGLRYPGDPTGAAWEVYNCRCTLVGRVNGVSMDLTDMSQRNTSHMQGMSYEEWKQAKAPKVEESKAFQEQLNSQEQSIKKNSTETAILLDKHGKVLFSKTEGLTKQVNFTSEETRLMKGATLTHNHPSGSTFSAADINLITEYGLKTIRATCDGQTFQLAKIPGVAINHNFANDYNDVHKKATELTKDLSVKVVSRAKKGEITPEEGIELLKKIDAKISGFDNEWLKTNAKSYGYRYSVIKDKR